MCMQCAMVAVSLVGAAGVMRHQIVARIDTDTGDDARPSPLLFLLILAALAEHDRAE